MPSGKAPPRARARRAGRAARRGAPDEGGNQHVIREDIRDAIRDTWHLVHKQQMQSETRGTSCTSSRCNQRHVAPRAQAADAIPAAELG